VLSADYDNFSLICLLDSAALHVMVADTSVSLFNR